MYLRYCKNKGEKATARHLLSLLDTNENFNEQLQIHERDATNLKKLTHLVPVITEYFQKLQQVCDKLFIGFRLNM